MKTVGEKIKAFRLDAGLSQTQLAQKLGISSQAVSKWETNFSQPDITLLPEIASLFGVPIDDLFGYTREKMYTKIERGSNMAMRSVMQNSSNLRTFYSRKQRKIYPLMRLTPCWVFSILATVIRFVRKPSTMARKPWSLSPTRSLTLTSSTMVRVGPYMIGVLAITRN